MQRLKLGRAWASYWVVSFIGVLPRAMQAAWPFGALSDALFPYAGWWALRQNPNLPPELKRAMAATEQDTGGENG